MVVSHDPLIAYGALDAVLRCTVSWIAMIIQGFAACCFFLILLANIRPEVTEFAMQKVFVLQTVFSH